MSKLNLKLPSVDDLFSTQDERESVGTIKEIPLNEIDSFPDHPFHVEDNEEMQQLTDSIKEHGVLTPAIVRQKTDGRYELVSGHRRKRASELAGLTTLKCAVVEMSDDGATVAMVDANFQREHILPSEKAFAYKMRMDALKHQGKASCQIGAKSRTDDLIAEETEESGRNIQRYIRLTKLISSFLTMIDEGKMPLNVGVSLSYLQSDEQEIVLEVMKENKIIPSIKQANELKRLSETYDLGRNTVLDVLTRYTDKPRTVSYSKKIVELIPQSIERSGYEDYIVKALRFYKNMKGDYEDDTSGGANA